MTVVLVEGFDHAHPTNKGWVADQTGSFHTNNSTFATARVTGYAFLVDVGSTSSGFSATYRIRKALPSNYTTLVAGFAMKIDGFTRVDQDTFQFCDTSGVMIAALRFDSSQRPYIVNSAGTTIATSASIIAFGAWNYYELKVYINGASGTCEMHINGGADITSTVGNFGSTNIYQVGFITQYTSAFSGTHRYYTIDDVYVVDTTSGSSPGNTFLGDCRIEALRPSGAGATTDWTPLSGGNYTNVDDDTPDGDTTYVSSATAGDIDTYDTVDLLATTGSIFAVQTNLYAKKDDTGTREIAATIRQGGADYVGATKTLSTSYATYTEIWENDPTADPWSISDVNADEFGVKVVT